MIRHWVHGGAEAERAEVEKRDDKKRILSDGHTDTRHKW